MGKDRVRNCHMGWEIKGLNTVKGGGGGGGGGGGA